MDEEGETGDTKGASVANRGSVEGGGDSKAMAIGRGEGGPGVGPLGKVAMFSHPWGLGDAGVKSLEVVVLVNCEAARIFMALS